MSRNFEEVELDEAERQRSRFVPVEVPAPARPVWNWEELNAKFRPRLVAAGVIRFGLTQDDCEDAVQTVFLKVLAMNPRVRDPKAYLRAAFLNQCKNILEARTTRSGRQTAISDQLAAVLPDAAAERARTVSAMSGAYRLVDPQCGQVVASYCVEAVTLAETVDRSGYAPKIVWKRIQGCLKRMRVCLAS